RAGGRAAAPTAVAAAGALSAAAASPPVPTSRAEIAEEARKGSRRGAAGATASVLDIIHSYRELGHLVADLDPLGDNAATHPLLELSQFGLTEQDLSRAVEIPAFKAKPVARLGELIEHLRATY